MYTQEEFEKAIGLAFYWGVDAGEKGIPDDFESYNPRHMEWYAQKGCDAKDEILKEFKREARDPKLNMTEMQYFLDSYGFSISGVQTNEETFTPFKLVTHEKVPDAVFEYLPEYEADINGPYGKVDMKPQLIKDLTEIFGDLEKLKT